MKILGEIIEVEQGRLYVPWFHRVAPSLQSNSRVHCVVFGGNHPELILSPFKVESWSDLWRIQCEFQDAKGLFARLTGILGGREINVNILAHETVTIREFGHASFSVDLICDMRGYGSRENPDSDTHERMRKPNAPLQSLCDYVTVSMFEHVRFRLGQPQVFASRLRELYHAALRLRKSSDDLEFSRPLVKGIVEIPDDAWKMLARSAQSDNGKFLITMSTDTEERFIRVGVLPQDKDAFLLQIRHTDREGKIAKFTRLLNEKFKNRLNINCSYLRLKEAGGDALWRCLLEADKGTSETLKKEIKEEFERSIWAFDDDKRLLVTWPDPINQSTEPIFPTRTVVKPS